MSIDYCEAKVIRVNGSWADSRKPDHCLNAAKFTWTRGGQIERLCGVHANTARRWYPDGEVGPIK